MKFIADEIDFGAYEAETEFKAKMRRASAYAEDLEVEFRPHDPKARAPRMVSTKLGRMIEFRPSEVTVWAGFNGHRKSMFTGQVALDLCGQNQRTLIVSLEMLPRRTLHRMCLQATASDAPTLERRREFMRWTDDRLWLFDHVGRLNTKRALALCRYFAEELKGKHVFIDSMMKLCESEESLDEQKKLIGDLCSLGDETGLHIHLVAHAKKPGQTGEDKPPSKYDIRGSSAISDQAHNIVMVWMNKAKREDQEKAWALRDPKFKEQSDHLVVIEKQRNGAVEGKFKLDFDSRCFRFIDDADDHVQAYDLGDLL